ncbi:unnamed protein product [Mytilus edulis]|uniref:CCHC-type domain-containing protein n=1 Tax=Mytilus edulis TaxID=6550 RepID=A0A8S3V656_MYTED|nr:unnamed protein product [Mytilus edulis]
MPTYGKLDSFDESEDWTQYVERMEHYFNANEIDEEDQKRDIFLSVCGKNTYKLIRDLLAPAKPGTKSLADLTKLVKDHRDPVPSEIIQRFKFNSRTRHSDESVRTFIAALRSLTEHCNYGDTLNAMLRDRLVVGIKSDRIQRRLLAEPNLTFEKALEIATAMETAEKNAQDIQAKTTLEIPKQGDCYRCGGNHLAAECRFKDAKCHSCKKKGHIAKKCRNKSANGNLSENHREFKSRFKPRAHFMEQDESSESENEVYSVFHFGNKSNEAYKVQINVNECEIAMEIDTGASVSIMSEDTYKEYKSKFRIEPTSAKLRTYMGEQIPVIGRAIVNVNYKKERAKLPLLIVKRKGPNLLGRDWLNKLQLDWKDIFSVVGSDNQSSDLNVILEANKEVFKDELGTVKGMKAKIYVDESAVPKYFKARPLPYALKDKVEMELERLEKEGQIQQVEFSDWAAPIVPVVKENGSIRICGDYKVTVNAVSKLDNYPIPKTEDLYATLGGGQEYTKLDLNQAYQQIELDESRLDLVFPNIEKRVQERQQKQKHYHDKKSVNRQINVGQGVFARNFAIGSKIKWIPGEVIKQSGPLSFHIKLQDGRVIRRHIDHIRVRNFDCTNNENEEKCDNDSDLFEPEITIPISTPETEQPQIEKPSNMTEQMEPRYPKRIRKEPSHLKDFVLK